MPILLLFFAWNFVEVHRYQNKKKEIFEDADRTLFRLKKEGGDLFFIQKKVNLVYGEFCEKHISSKDIQEFLENFRKSNLGFIEFYFFDKKSDFISYPGDDGKFRKVLSRLYLALSEPEAFGQDKMLQQYKPVFKSLLGDVDPNSLIGMKGTFIPVSLSSKPGFFYWNTFYRSEDVFNSSNKRGAFQPDSNEPIFQGGMMAVFEEEKIPKGLSIQTLLGEINKDCSEGNSFGCFDFGDLVFSKKWSEFAITSGIKLEELGKAIREMQKKFIRQEVLSDYLISILPFDEEKVFFGIYPLRNLQDFKIKGILLLISLFIFFLVILFAYKIYITQEFKYISIRKKLIALFLYATAIPTFSFVLLCYQYLSDKKDVMLNEQFSKLQDAISNLDENYQIALNQLKTRFLKLSRSSFLKKRDIAKLGKIYENWNEKDISDSIFLGESSGEFSFKPPKSKTNDFAVKVITTIMRKMFQKKNVDTPGLGKNFFAEAMVDSLAESLVSVFGGTGGAKSLFEQFLRKTDELHEISLGNQTQYFFLSFIPGPSGPFQSLLIINETKRTLSKHYLRWAVEKRGKKIRKAFSIQLGYSVNSGNREIKPVEFSKYPFLKEIIEKVQSSRNPQTGFFQISGENYLIACSPLKKMGEYIAFALFPQKIIDGTIKEISLKMFGISIMSGIFAFFIGLILSKQFIWPIRELAFGIQAIEDRKFDYCIPSLANDEFGDLGVTFNRMMESLQEIHVAKVVQEALFPEKSLLLGEYEVTGSSETMSDLGGDFFDYFVIADRYILTLIGDVTGHGISAALLMAMAKSGIFMLEDNIILNPVASLERINQMIFRTVKKKKMMTFFYSVIDIQENKFLFSNAGHCYPIFYTNSEQRLDFLKLPAYPLGSRNKTRYQLIEKRFESEDVLVLYTDGIVETKDINDEMIGFHGIEKMALSTLMNFSTSREIHDQLWKEFETSRDFRPSNDDVTLIVIKRRIAPKNNKKK
ncbi:MAG: SpoIIE family protein phosphatase [Candidatus Riflebacteria bacterium]|nr:SpoIIE family protein phosphatase [Candidatus Riflebacteria bacterium]